jgi:anti-anti-sigma factor
MPPGDETCGLVRIRIGALAVVASQDRGGLRQAMAVDSVVIERAEPDVAVVVMSGEHDAFHAPQLEAHVTSLLEQELSLVIDLSHATFLDSVTLFVLIRGRKHAATLGRGFALQLGAGAGRHVHKAFELTRLTSVFAIADTRAEAVALARIPVGLE